MSANKTAPSARHSERSKSTGMAISKEATTHCAASRYGLRNGASADSNCSGASSAIQWPLASRSITVSASQSFPIRRSRFTLVGLWALQVVLAALFFMAGGSKLAGAPAMVHDEHADA